MARGMCQQRSVLGHQLTDLDVAVTGQRTDGQVIAGVVDVRQVAEPTNVDDDGRIGEAELHHRQQRVTAGHQLGFVAVLIERGQRLGGRRGPDVVERYGNHRSPPPAAVRTAWTMLW